MQRVLVVDALIVLMLTVGRGSMLHAQVGESGNINGAVTTRESGVALQGVRVSIPGTAFAAVTGGDGRYVIPGVPPGAYQLQARLIGYSADTGSVVVTAGGTVTADFVLEARAIELTEVVAIGYGSAERRDLTGAIGSVSSRSIATIPVARVDQAISGLVSGVQVQTTNAQPGAELRIRVRGGNSVQGNNEPLVVLDGVIGADLSQVSPSDIESVNVLKDASATAIYGARAANGVLLVTTKRGQGQVRFEYNGYAGVQGVTKYIDVLTADEFARLYMRNPDNLDEGVTFDTLSTLLNTDWQRAIYRTAPMRSHEIRVSGSTGGTSLMVSAGLFDQEGVVRGSDFSRGSLRVNLDQLLGERFRMGTSVSYSRSVANAVRVNDGYGTAGGPVTQAALRFAPTIPVFDSEGQFSGPLLPDDDTDNPLAIIRLRDDKSTTDYLIGNVFGEYQLVPGLTVRSSLAYTSNDFLRQRYVSQQLREALGEGEANIQNREETTWLSENTVSLRRTLGGSHDVTVLGGFSAQETRRTGDAQEGRGFASDLLGYRRINLAEVVTGSSSASRERVVSFLGRVQYGFAGKYLVTGTLRADGSSKFAVNNKWAIFPSAAVAWRASEEPFFRGLAPTVSELKLRLSGGMTGNEAIDPLQSLATWDVGAPYAVGTTTLQNGATPDRIANPDLRWETTVQYDAGVDLGLFDNKVSLIVDAYQKTTRDLLHEKQLPYVSGYDAVLVNIGKVRNRGLEVALNTRHTIGGVQLDLGGNVSLNRSKVLDLGGDLEFFEDGVNRSLPSQMRGSALIRVGEPLGNFYGYIWDGIFQDSAEVANSGQTGARIGGMKLKDVNGRDSLTGELTGMPDGRITEDDRTILGNAQPDYLFNLTGSLTYKSLSLSFIVRGVQGFEVVNLNREGMETPGDDSNTLRSVLNYWTPENRTNTMTALGVGPVNLMTSRWVEDGSFVRLQNVTLSWDLPVAITGRYRVDRLRVYVSGQNLFTSTDYSWYDPEVSSRGTRDLELGWDDAGYPGTRTITVGVYARF